MLKMLGTFPKAFPKARQLPECIFPSGKFPIEQFPKRTMSVVAAALGPLVYSSRSARPTEPIISPPFQPVALGI